MGSQSFLFLLLFPLLNLNPSLSYSLRNCSIEYSTDASAEVSLDCSGRKLVTIPDDIPRNAKVLKLNENHIERINREDFGDLSNLRNLTLHSNKISHVDDGSFVHLKGLKYLDMGKNKLPKLTENIFQGLFNLTVLYLQENRIQFIHASAFQFLTRLQTLELYDNLLQQISEIQPILQLPQLQNLGIGSNEFSSFESKDLQPNVSSGLKMLDVFSNKFEKFSITTQMFPHLETLDLSRCGHEAGMTLEIPHNVTQLYFNNNIIRFQEIKRVLQSLDSLVHLRLYYMTRLINEGLLATVCKIPTLRKLDLYIKDVDNVTGKLVACSQLSELDLSSTHMTDLPNGSIRSMKRLKFLKLDTNILTKVPDDIRALSSLEVLNLEHNHISELTCEDFVNTTSLSELNLNKNKIAKLDRCVFESLNNLKVLELSDNLIRNLGGAFDTGLKKLEFLDLSKNFNIRIIDSNAFQSLGSLKNLDVVSKRNVWVGSKTFDGLTSLASLSMSLEPFYENHFEKLQQLEKLTIYFNSDRSFKSPNPNYNESTFPVKSLKTFKMISKGYHYGFPFDLPVEMQEAMTQLEDFTAENVGIDALDPDTFQFNNQLKSLTIVGTDLSDLNPELFWPIPNLESLDLSDSKLKSLEFLSQAGLSALRRLTLRQNEITVISETVFQSLPALTHLDLAENPFTCDCSNAGFIQWVKSNNQTQVVNAYQYACSFPAAQQGSMLLDFDFQSCWMDVSFLCFISSSGVVVLTLLASFIYHFLRWQLAYAYHLFLAFLYDSRKRKKGAALHYDAFISYNVHDEAWVLREMLPVLEGEQGWRLCLHHRDFQPGKPIIENITDAIYGSRKTICVISRRYLQSEWCSREIQMASFRLFDEQKDVLILLFLEEIPAYQMSPYYRMRKLVKRRTYLSWPQAGPHTGLFWQKVQRALETGEAPTNNTDPLTGQAGC